MKFSKWIFAFLIAIIYTIGIGKIVTDLTIAGKPVLAYAFFGIANIIMGGVAAIHARD